MKDKFNCYTGTNNDEFVEWETFYGYYYGSLKSFVNDQLEKDNSIVFELDVKGALKIKNEYPDAISIFIMPPSLEELKIRLKNRKTENDEKEDAANNAFCSQPCAERGQRIWTG